MLCRTCSLTEYNMYKPITYNDKRQKPYRVHLRNMTKSRLYNRIMYYYIYIISVLIWREFLNRNPKHAMNNNIVIYLLKNTRRTIWYRYLPTYLPTYLLLAINELIKIYCAIIVALRTKSSSGGRVGYYTQTDGRTDGRTRRRRRKQCATRQCVRRRGWVEARDMRNYVARFLHRLPHFFFSSKRRRRRRRRLRLDI